MKAKKIMKYVDAGANFYLRIIGDADHMEILLFRDTLVPKQQNAAERAIRPAVISRKISSGTRSAKGSQTKTRLMSVFAIWKLQGKDSIAACADMIVAANTPLAICPQ